MTAVKCACTRDMSRGDWLRIRTYGIGGSDAAKIFGLVPYSEMGQTTSMTARARWIPRI